MQNSMWLDRPLTRKVYPYVWSCLLFYCLESARTPSGLALCSRPLIVFANVVANDRKSPPTTCLRECPASSYARIPEAAMTETDIRDSIKQSIARITGIPPNEISDSASYHDDLGLDSLSMLEIAVDA